MGKTKLTVRLLERLETPAKRYNIFDAETRGLGVAIHPSGTKTFFHLQKVNGWPRRTTIGTWPDVSIESARGTAEEISAKLSRWKLDGYSGPDPLKRPTRVSTLGDVLKHYVENHLTANAKNPAHATWYANWQFDRYLAPLRNRPLGTIGREHIRELHKTIAEKHGAVTANRTITFIRTLYGHATHPDVLLYDGVNPAAKPRKFLFHETSRERTIAADEFPKFFKALMAHETERDLRDFVLLALSTGARRGTIFQMRWEQLDFSRGLWTIPNPKGRKNRGPHVVPLSQLAVATLKQRPRDSEWIFPGRKGHLTTIHRPWAEFIRRAGIQQLRIHDLRRTLATHEGQTGATAEVIQKTLGHEESSVATKIYDRSDRQPEVRAAIDAAVTAIVTAGKTSVRKLLTAANQEKA